MPNTRLEDLPESVRHILPKQAQRIYRANLNHAWDTYRDPADRKGGADREEAAHKVAWAAVKQQYETHGDRWRRKANTP